MSGVRSGGAYSQHSFLMLFSFLKIAFWCSNFAWESCWIEGSWLVLVHRTSTAIWKAAVISTSNIPLDGWRDILYWEIRIHIEVFSRHHRILWVGRTSGGHRVQPTAQSRSDFKITSCCSRPSPTEFWKSAMMEISQPRWATYSTTWLIHCEISCPLHPAGMSVVITWIFSCLSLHCHLQEKAAPLFSEIPLYAQLKTAIRFLLSLLQAG